ncbi:hypothetical protein [Sandarakinorhabdus rubra]|uniref:hypothetical protein n=1 Tax=Sandarakinorhabdus rubra TaxID=2672568 RepID=UPI0013DD4B99|nr:hypothetical protein [Sandarakinorhabdus rubra]
MNQLTRATCVGIAAQIAMVTAGHYVPAIANLFAIGGLGISALTGWGAMKQRPVSLAEGATGGALAGGLCAAAGIALSVVLGDVPFSLLPLGTLGSAITGMVGGLIGRSRG